MCVFRYTYMILYAIIFYDSYRVLKIMNMAVHVK